MGRGGNQASYSKVPGELVPVHGRLGQLGGHFARLLFIGETSLNPVTESAFRIGFRRQSPEASLKKSPSSSTCGCWGMLRKQASTGETPAALCGRSRE